MRHLQKGRSLGTNPSHRRAMLRNLVSSLLVHERIETTMVRAKEMRRYLDKMIVLGKHGDLHARRQAMRFVHGKKAMFALFGTLASRYQSRDGGYSRIFALSPRRGDAAPMVAMVLVDSPKDPFSSSTAAAQSTPAKQIPEKEVKPKA